MLSHFPAALIFALCVSVVFGITQRDTKDKMIRFGVFTFVCLIGAVIGASWLFWIIKR